MHDTGTAILPQHRTQIWGRKENTLWVHESIRASIKECVSFIHADILLCVSSLGSFNKQDKNSIGARLRPIWHQKEWKRYKIQIQRIQMEQVENTNECLTSSTTWALASSLSNVLTCASVRGVYSSGAETTLTSINIPASPAVCWDGRQRVEPFSLGFCFKCSLCILSVINTKCWNHLHSLFQHKSMIQTYYKCM